jgi:hypothetical protein
MTEQEQNAAFEADVRRIARALYPSSASGEAELHLGRERDGLFMTDELVIIIEATVSRKREKVAGDAKKTAELIRSFRTKYPDHMLMGIIVTKDAPTAEQVEAVRKYRPDHVKIESYDHFRQRLFDGRAYLRCRDNYAFGSAKGQDGSARLDETKIIPLDLIARGQPGNQEALSLIEFANRFNSGESSLRAVLVGDFGAGKSTSLLSIYRHAANNYLSGTARLPLLLNLRDHTGQKNAVEAIERHARNIGYPSPSKLVAAFWAGEVSLLLDGFDELAPFAPFSTNARRIREIRRDSVTLVRDFLSRAPRAMAIIVSGRSHYFDNESEMEGALGIDGRYVIYDLNEFTHEQIEEFFTRNGVRGVTPAWLPSRPLLLGYLIQKKILGSDEVFSDSIDRGVGWSTLLEEISKREAEVNSNLDANVIKQIMERLATLAGKSTEGLGPVSNLTIYRTWNEISGGDPDTAAQQFLLRLPGLQPAEESGEERKFIDSDFAAAARAGDVVRLVETPHSLDLGLWDHAYTELQAVGADVAAAGLKKAGINATRLRLALQRIDGHKEYGSLGVSLVRAAAAASLSIPKPSVVISEAIIEIWTLDKAAPDLSGVVFRGCLIVNLVVGPGWEAGRGPEFEGCEILTVAGRSSEADLPTDNFRECAFQRFTAELVSTASILKLNLAPAVVVLLTIVEKLFFQPGRGRDENAFPRGLDHKLRPLVPELLDILRVCGWAEPYRSSGKSIWIPNRAMSANARALLSAPTTSTENLMKLAKNLA